MVDKSALLTLSGIVVRRWSRGWDRVTLGQNEIRQAHKCSSESNEATFQERNFRQ